MLALHGVDNVVVGVAQRNRILNIQAHAARVGLAQDVRRVDFHGDREADLFGIHQRVSHTVRHHGLGDGNLEGAQHRFGFHFRECFALFRQHRIDQHAGALDA